MNLKVVNQAVISKPKLPEIRIPGSSMAEIERYAILATVAATGSCQAAASVLDISVRKIQYRLKQYRETSTRSPGP